MGFASVDMWVLFTRTGENRRHSHKINPPPNQLTNSSRDHKYNHKKTMNNLKGHGDPLLVATMKNLAVRARQEDEKLKLAACRQTHSFSHGDPLFEAVQKHHSPTLKRATSLPVPLALHTELVGHGDPLMEKVMASWKMANVLSNDKERQLHAVVHGARKKHGDPLFHEWLKANVDSCGEGDPLMAAFLTSWNIGATKENLHPMAHGDHKKHGDPLLQEFVATIE